MGGGYPRILGVAVLPLARHIVKKVIRQRRGHCWWLGIYRYAQSIDRSLLINSSKREAATITIPSALFTRPAGKLATNTQGNICHKKYARKYTVSRRSVNRMCVIHTAFFLRARVRGIKGKPPSADRTFNPIST